MKSILIVETDRFSRCASASALNEAGYNTQEADSFAAGINCMSNIIPSAAILDFQLEHDSGLDLYAQMQWETMKSAVLLIKGLYRIIQTQNRSHLQFAQTKRKI